MILRKKNVTTIQYILVADGSPIIAPFLPPNAFNNEVIDFVRRCPMDLLQFSSSLNFLEFCIRNNWYCGYDFTVFNADDYSTIKEILDSSKQIQFFFLNGNSKTHEKIFEDLQNDNPINRFFNFYNCVEPIIQGKNIIASADHFLSTIINQQNELFEYLKVTNLDISLSVSLDFKGFNEFDYFVPTRNNYFLVNNIIGNFHGSYKTDNKEAEIQKAKVEGEVANEKKHIFDRQLRFIKQINNLDFFFRLTYEKSLIKLASGIEAYLPPLIVVLPFHNPDLKELYSEKEIISFLQVEQTENYVNVVSLKSDLQRPMAFAGMRIIKNRVGYLDDVSFLHSSFSFSPVVRLPIKGKSIYRELSFFNPRLFPKIPDRKKIKKTIYDFGKKLKESTISKELEKLIKNRNGQIVAISDLPIEWTLIEDVPLSFTHDVCRLPETSLHGLMSFFANNHAFEYSIPADIVKRTLVVLGTDEDAFKVWHESTFELSEKLGFRVVKCNSLTDLKQSIEDFKPDLLIFDCHGDYDPVTRSTYLFIGQEKLDGDYVVKNEIYAPMIFLSACGTAPTYGTMNPIANAFFEAGSISVTSTYMPISVNSGSLLYLRLLGKLDYASQNAIHKNWLEFVSHVIRSSSINDAYLLALKKQPSLIYFNSNVKSLTESLQFTKRRKLYYNMDKEISSLTNDDRKYYSEVIPEYLMYSNMGRGDLILFECWKEEFSKKTTTNIS